MTRAGGGAARAAVAVAAVAILTGALGCGGRDSADDPAAWAAIDALRSPPIGGDPRGLLEAIEIRQRRADAWDKVVPPLTDHVELRLGYDDVPESAAAVAALSRWVDDGAGLPPADWVGRIDDSELPMLDIMRVAKVALYTATAEDPRGLRAVLVLAHRLRHGGEGMLATQVGFALAEQAAELASRDHLWVDELATLAPTDAEVVPALAAEASRMRQHLEELATPAGQARSAARLREFGIEEAAWDSRHDAMARGIRGALLASLAGARRDDGRATVKARLKAACAGAPRAAAVVTDVLPSHVERLYETIDRYVSARPPRPRR